MPVRVPNWSDEGRLAGVACSDDPAASRGLGGRMVAELHAGVRDAEREKCKDGQKHALPHRNQNPMARSRVRAIAVRRKIVTQRPLVVTTFR